MARINLNNARFWLFTTLLIAAPLSKFPSFSTPAYGFTSFRIGLYPILSLLFVLCCLLSTTKAIPKLYKYSRSSMLSIAVLVLVSILGVTTAIYKARSLLLLISVLLLICLLVSSWWYVAYEFPRDKYKWLLKLVLIAGVFYGVISILQFIFAGFGHETFGLLCTGCNSQVFGFPRINGFAAEPQFHANALLIYFFAGLVGFYGKNSRLALASALLSLVSIGLTFSRGAYLAVGLSTLLFFILMRLQGRIRLRTIGRHFGILIIAILVVTGLFIAAASFQYRSTPDIAYKTFRSFIQQASLGVIKLPQSKSESGFTPAGLVQASGQERIGASQLALKAWKYNIRTLIVGVGPGNLGPFTVRHIAPNAPRNLTVYIYYILILSEFGIVGLAALLLLYGNALRKFLRLYWGHKNAPLYSGIFCLGIAFLVQYSFFGSYINVPYIWLWFGIILGLGQKAGKRAII